MPTYSYACTDCGDRFDVVQAFTDDSLTTCAKCSGRLRKLFGSVGVVFKGSGFYRTDSRDSNKSSLSSTGQTKAGSGEGGSSSGSADKAAATEKAAPAKTEKAATSSAAVAAG